MAGCLETGLGRGVEIPRLRLGMTWVVVIEMTGGMVRGLPGLVLGGLWEVGGGRGWLRWAAVADIMRRPAAKPDDR